MLKQIIIGGIVGGITLFAWGFISWTVLTWHFDTIRQDEGIHAVVANVTDHLPEAGVYFYPPMTEAHRSGEGGAEAWAELHRSGPHGYVVVQPNGSEPTSPIMLAKGFVADVVAAMMASLLLIAALPSLRNYRARVVFVASLGVFAILSGYIVDGIFHDLPVRYTVGLATDTAIAWTLTGLALAAIVK